MAKEFIDLNAKTTEVIVIEPPIKGSGPGVYLEKCECKNSSKPYERSEVEAMIEKALSLGGDLSTPSLKPKQLLRHHLDNFNAWNEQRHNDELESAEQFKNNQLSKITTSSAYEKIISQTDRDVFLKEKTKKIESDYNQRVAEISEVTKNLKNIMEDDLNFFYVKRKIDYPLADYDQTGNTASGICLGVKINYASKNPFSPASMIVTIVLADNLKEVQFSLADQDIKPLVEAVTLSKSDMDMSRSIYASEGLLDKWDDLTKQAREDISTKFIITGNIERALTNEDFKKQSTAISYSTTDGKAKEGLLLNDGFRLTVGKINVPVLKALPLIIAMGGAHKEQYAIQQAEITISKNKRYWIISAGKNDNAVHRDEAFNAWGLHKWEKKGNAWQIIIDNESDLSKAIQYLDSRYGFNLSVPSDVFQTCKEQLGYGDAINEDMGIIPVVEPESMTEEPKENIPSPEVEEKLDHISENLLNAQNQKTEITQKVGSVDQLTDLEKKKLRYYLDRYKKEIASEKDLKELTDVIQHLNPKLTFSELGQKQLEHYLPKHRDGKMKLHEYNTLADIVLNDYENSLFKKTKVNVN